MKSQFIIIFSIFLLALTLGCTGTGQVSKATNGTNQTVSALAVKAGDSVSVDYIGMYTNGTVFDTSIGRAPLEFSAGAGQMIKGFDDAVIGMKIGDEKNVTIAPENAYGSYSDINIISVPLAQLPNGTSAGDTLYSAGRSVIVLEVNSTAARIDMNHPLAGKTLVFWIKMLNITRA
jgi:peptidylprolyl isomerase